MSYDAEIYEDVRAGGRWKELRCRIWGITGHSGHLIRIEDGWFRVESILPKGGILVELATKNIAELAMAHEWEKFASSRKPETCRQFDGRFESMHRCQRIAESNFRNHLADAVLKKLMQPGDRMRATKAECCAHEASFTFSHWNKGWLVTKGGAIISPGSVQSVNGKNIRV